MNATHLIASLERFAHILPALVRDVSAGDAKWNPAGTPEHPAGAWSILEIVAHLCDEEVNDFRTRLKMTLESPAKEWPPIDPPRWAIERKYNEGDLRMAVDRFVRDRGESIAWLKSLKPSPSDVDWSIAHVHPKFGRICAGDLLTSWAAHDALHLRQIAKRMYQLAQRDGNEFSAEYAGEWSA